VRRAQVESASFGADALGAIGVDAGTLVSTLSSTGGPGICVNYWTDGPSKYNNGGNGYLDALRALNPGTLRYPGGEKADSCAPPCPPSHPLPLRGPRGRLRGRRGAAAGAPAGHGSARLVCWAGCDLGPRCVLARPAGATRLLMIQMWMPRPGPGAARRYAWAPPPWTADTKPRPEMTRSMPYDWPYNDKNMFTAATNPVTCARRALPRPTLTLPRPARPPRMSIRVAACAAGSVPPDAASERQQDPAASLRTAACISRLPACMRTADAAPTSAQHAEDEWHPTERTRKVRGVQSAVCRPQYA